MIHECIIKDIQLEKGDSNTANLTISIVFGEQLNGDYIVSTRYEHFKENDEEESVIGGSNQTVHIEGNTATYEYTISDIGIGRIIFVTSLVGDSATDISNARTESIPIYICYFDDLPILTLNIYEGETLTNTSFNFILEYSQVNNEPIDYCIFDLYDENLNFIDTSNRIFNPNTPPLFINHTFNGFENNHTYYINARVKTLHGMEAETGNMEFNVFYDAPILFSKLKVNPNCDLGCVEVSSNIFVGNGITNPDPMVYVDEGEKYSAYAIKSDPVIKYGSLTSGWIYWEKGVNLEKNFILKFWFNVGTINNNIIRLYNHNGKYVNVRFKRLRSQYSEFDGDYVEVTTSENGVINSNIITTRDNGNTRYFLWIKVVDDEWEVILSQEYNEEIVFNWNDSNNNLQWNQTSDLKLYGEDYENNILLSPNQTRIEEELECVLIGNAICRQFLITNDTSLEYSDEFEDGDEYTVLRCDFDQNVRGGNIIEQLIDIDSIKIKRKDDSNNLWLDLYTKKIVTEDDLNVMFRNYGVPRGIKQTYALVPVMANGSEGNYLIKEITPMWNACYISDGIKSFKVYSSINYGSSDKNKPVGVMNPIGNTYPIIIQNGDNNYLSGTFSGQILGYNYELTRQLDRNDVVKQTQDFVEFLVNGRSKFIYDWNGNTWLVKVTSSPSISYNNATTNGTNTVTFSWVEQGKYNNETDLDKNGFVIIE